MPSGGRVPSKDVMNLNDVFGQKSDREIIEARARIDDYLPAARSAILAEFERRQLGNSGSPEESTKAAELQPGLYSKASVAARVKSGLNHAAFGPVSHHNRIYRANMTGGILGWLGDSGRRALRYAAKEANNAGYEIVVVVPDTTNILQRLLYTAILLLTLFLWCPEPGYLVVCKRLADGDHTD